MDTILLLHPRQREWRQLLYMALLKTVRQLASKTNPAVLIGVFLRRYASCVYCSVLG